MNHARFVQFAFSTPERLRLRGDRTKYIHVEFVAGLMPRRVLDRKDKAYFSFALLDDVAKMAPELVGSILSADRLDSQGRCGSHGVPWREQSAFREAYVEVVRPVWMR